MVESVSRGEKRARRSSANHLIKLRREKRARRNKNWNAVSTSAHGLALRTRRSADSTWKKYAKDADGHEHRDERGVGGGAGDEDENTERDEERDRESDGSGDGARDSDREEERDAESDGEGEGAGDSDREEDPDWEGELDRHENETDLLGSGVFHLEQDSEVGGVLDKEEGFRSSARDEPSLVTEAPEPDIVDFIMNLNGQGVTMDDENGNSIGLGGVSERGNIETVAHHTHLSFEIGEVEVEQVSRRLKKIVEDRVQSSRKCPKSRAKNSASRRKQLEPSDRSEIAIQKSWLHDMNKLRRLKPDFFSSRQATLRDDSKTTKGIALYEGIPLNQFNNSDVQSIFLMEYERKTKCGGSYSSFLQLTTVAGQFMRLRVVRKLSFLNVLHKNGEMFRAVCDRETVDLFLDHYDAKSQCTTVMTKALHLKKIAEHAILYFSDRDQHLQAEAERSRLKLQKYFNVQKALGRRLATQKKQMSERIAEGIVFFPADFKRGRKKAREQLQGILNTYVHVKNDRGAQVAREKVSQAAVIHKWFINMLLLLIFSAGGQRPQAYSQMQTPTETELLDMSESVRLHDFFQLRTAMEKTQRSLDMPNVIVPGFVLKYVRFHTKIMRKVVVEKTSVDEQADDDRPLIMHTETGEALTTPQVTNTLKGYLRCAMPEAQNITMMSLRSSYCTMVMQDYRQKKIFPTLSEQEFLEVLSKNLNTSPEQLRSTYIGIDVAEFEDTAKELVKVVGDAESSED